jgi:hypothetical protein
MHFLHATVRWNDNIWESYCFYLFAVFYVHFEFTQTCLLLYVIVAFFESFSISSLGFHSWHGVDDSGYCDFIAKMLDKVPSSLSWEWLSVLFFRTMLKSLSCSALLCGITNTTSAIFGRCLKRLCWHVSGTFKWARCHHRMSTLWWTILFPSSSLPSTTFASCYALSPIESSEFDNLQIHHIVHQNWSLEQS